VKSPHAKTVMIMVDGMPAGGTERQIVELLKGLREAEEFTTALGVLQKGGAREAEALSLADIEIPIRQSGKYDFSLAFSLIKHIRHHYIDIIHTFGCVSDFSGLVAGKICGIPVINGSIRSARPRLNQRDRFSRLWMRYADAVVANSVAGLRAFGVEDLLHARVIYNGMDLNRFEGVVPERHGDTCLCMVGNFTAKKDQQALIRALPLIKKKWPQTRLLLVGRGEGVEPCRRLAGELGVGGDVLFFTDTNHPEPIIAGSCIGILLSPNGEGLSNVILEYMALGKPVIATGSGGSPELVESGVNGLLVQSHEVHTIFGAVDSLLSDPQRMDVMGKAGRWKIEKTFSASIMVENYRQLYDLLLRSA